MKSRHDELRERAKAFHVTHPDVMELFERFTLELITRGFKHYGAQAVFERVRWETPAGEDGLSSFKVNNDYAAFYARSFRARHPEHRGFFRLRKQRSKDKPASELPELGPDNYKESAT